MIPLCGLVWEPFAIENGETKNAVMLSCGMLTVLKLVVTRLMVENIMVKVRSTVKNIFFTTSLLKRMRSSRNALIGVQDWLLLIQSCQSK